MEKGIGLMILLGFLTVVGCQKQLTPEEQLKKDIQEIEKYIADHEIQNVETTDSGLHFVVEKVGTGNHPATSDNVTVRYKGYTLTNKVFDESSEDGITFNLHHVIAGWTEGIPKFKEGGRGLLLIPSKLAYGEKGNASIAPNTVLVFEVELLNIEN